jgi:tetratricopeptide (TPR) repeat protein
MFCYLCGANIPDGSPRCSKCKNYFPKNLGDYPYQVVLTAFADYRAKKETAKYLAAHTPNTPLTAIVKRLEGLPLVIAKKVNSAKAKELEVAFMRLGARVRFVPVIENETEKGRLIAELKRPIKRSYAEGKRLAIPKSVERLETETKTAVVSPKFVLVVVSVVLFAVIFIILPHYYQRFYEEHKGLSTEAPTPASPLPGPPEPGGEDSVPADVTNREAPVVIIPEITTKPRDPTIEEGISLYQRGKYGEALEKFLSALKKNPVDETLKRNVALSYLALGWDELNKDNLPDAEKYLLESLNYGEQYQAYEGLGFIAEKKKDLASAEKNYAKALELNPEADDVMLSLGIVYYYQERLDDSLALLSKFSERNPSNETARYYIEKIERENPVESGLMKRETGHFVVKYSGSTQTLVGDILLPILEEAYSSVGSRLNYYPNHKVTVILYTDEEFTAATDSPGWAGAIYDGKIRIPTKGVSGSSNDLKKMVFHEYTHALVFDLAGERCPTWLNEGLAQYMEDAPVDPADKLVIDYMKQNGKDLPLKGLSEGFTGMPADAAYTAYMMSLSATSFLIKKYGESSVKAILAAIKAGKSIDQAIQDTLLISFDDFVDRWEVYLQNKPS